jgi:hypothetical protein
MRAVRDDRPVLAAALGLAMASGVLVACAEPAERRGPQAIRSWTTNGGTVIALWIDTCHGDPKADVAETETTVTITVISTRRNPGDACQDSLDVTLATPLGDRTLLDGTTGRAPEPVEG